MKNIPMTYKELLSQSSASIEAAQLENKVAMAQNEFAQGLLSVNSEIIKATGKLKQAEGKVTNAEAAITKALRSEPDEIVQNLINAYQTVEQAKLDVIAVQHEIDELQAIHNFLKSQEKMLFAV